MLPQWHVKNKQNGSFCQKCRWQVTLKHAYTRDPTKSESRHSVGTYQENNLPRNSPGNTQPQSSQLAEPLQTDPDLKSGTGVRELISTLNRRREKSDHQNGGPCFRPSIRTFRSPYRPRQLKTRLSPGKIPRQQLKNQPTVR